MFTINVTFLYEISLIQWIYILVSTVSTDALVLKHQGISTYSAEYRPLCFQPFMG